jgi:type II secretory pathway pseudopilin PulG
MVKDRRQVGFSLTETLLAVATLAIGMVFIGGTFLTGVFFSTLSTERTTAAVAADEAFAKIRLDGLNPSSSAVPTDSSALVEPLTGRPADEQHLYPSTRLERQRQYSWSALCRRMGPSSPLVQCTVFISRQINGATYWVRRDAAAGPQLVTAALPQPVRINVVQDPAVVAQTPEEAKIVSLKDAIPTDAVDELAFVNDGATLVDDATGQIYRVLERFGNPPDRLRLDPAWAGGASGSVWVVPPATSGGRNPVVAVYQDVLRFPGQ